MQTSIESRQMQILRRKMKDNTTHKHRYRECISMTKCHHQKPSATRHATRGWELQATDINKKSEKEKCIHLTKECNYWGRQRKTKQHVPCHDRILRKGATWSKKSCLSFVCTAHNLTWKAPKLVVKKDILIWGLIGCADKSTYAPTSNSITRRADKNANSELQC